ncbi:MAG: ATP phosphoribosyltransferase regulatory subunit [Candidatus Pacearchaeota archaeon]
MDTKTAKGFSDFIGEESNKRERIIEEVKRQFELYGFESAETPIIENEEFVRGKNFSDEAVRDIFTLQDRGKRKLALRYEFTFQLKRIAKNQKLPYKRYQIGYVFRDEPIRKGRLRQFIQCDADIVGSSIKDEAEILAIAKKVFSELGISVKIYINNRKLLNEILVSENIKEKDRESVIKELDKLDKLSKKEVADNLKNYNAEKLVRLFEQDEEKFSKYGFYKEIEKLKDYCKNYNVEVEFKPFLARGLSYYNGSVFEIWSEKLNVSLAGGGSYLVDETQSTGISFGLEPIFLLSEVQAGKIDYQVISIGQDEEAIKLSGKLRDSGKKTILILDKTPSKAVEYANAKDIEKVIFVGKEEVEKKKYKVKDMKSGEEETLSEGSITK